MSVKRIHLPVFRWYKAKFGDVRVKQKYEIPPEENIKIPPELFSSNKLGLYVKLIRRRLRKPLKNEKFKYNTEDVEELLKMGFIPHEPTEKNRLILLATSEYKEKNGNCDIVRSFVIPKDDPSWSKEVRGMKLGVIINNIRNQEHHAEIRDDLTALGVDLTAQIDFNLVYNGLVAYKQINGHIKVTNRFVVPENDSRFPENTWGMKLGYHLFNIRCKDTWSEHREKLGALGVNFEVKSQPGFEVILSALQSYKQIHGHLKVPRKFIVPENDANYPENTWGMKLGFAIGNIRTRGDFASHREKLETLGVTVGNKASKGKEKLELIEID